MMGVAALLSSPVEAERSLLSSVAEALHVPARIVVPTSWVGHIPFASWIVKEARPRVIVELGVHTGNSLFTFAEAAQRFAVPTQIHGIDTWAGDEHAGAYAEDVFLDVSAVARSRFPDNVHLVRKYFDEALADFADGSVDLLHIDGLHTYEAVRHDFETWRPKLSERAIVLFHDIAVEREGFGVRRYWQELQSTHRTFSFAHSNGLGALLFGSSVPEPVARFTAPAHDAAGFLLLFERLGSVLERMLEHGPDVDAMPINAALEPPRIYVAYDGAFEESSAVDARRSEGAPGTLSATFAPMPDVDRIAVRIDPMNGVGIRAVHRVLVYSGNDREPAEIVPDAVDLRTRLTIVRSPKGYLFVGTGDDSQWIPRLDSAARAAFQRGATVVFEPMTVPTRRVTRLLLEDVDQLVLPATLAAQSDRDLAVLCQRNDELAHQVADRVQEVSHVRAEADRLSAEAGTATAEVERLRPLLEQRQEEVIRLHAEIGQLTARTARFESLQAAHEALVTARDRLLGEHASRDARDGEAAALLDELHNLHVHAVTPSAEALDRLDVVLKRVADFGDAPLRRLSDSLAGAFRAQQMIAGENLVQQRNLDAAGRGDAIFLRPQAGLAPLDASGQRWRALDQDPQFALSELLAFRGRWVEFHLKLAIDERPAGSPTIYLDEGRGMSEADSISLPQPDAETGECTFIFVVPPALQQARFDPCTSAVDFTLGAVRIRPLSRWQAMRSMAVAMRGTGRLEALRQATLSKWWLMTSGKERARVKGEYVSAYRATLYLRSSTYSEWIKTFEVARAAYPLLAAKRERWDRQPLISVLMPTYNTPARFLKEVLESVISQEYANWELCIADDGSTSPHVRRLLTAAASREPRIKLAFRETNGHICAASNTALALASGEFVALLDHDDLLHPLALHYLAEAVVLHPDAEVIYSDEDKIDVAGARSVPYFKSDYNYELFLSQNMINHLGAFRTSSVREVEGFRPGLEGSQDWDLALRVVERTEPGKVVHIPRVLYHWRGIPGSTALTIDEKPYAQIAGRRAVADHLARRAIDATVTPDPEMLRWNRVRYAVPVPVPRVSIVIPTRDKVDILKVCVDSILERTTYPDYEILIIDNGSVEPATIEYLQALPSARVAVVRDDSPFNYSRLNNSAVEKATGSLVCLLNNDIEIISADWLEEMVGIAMQPRVGIVGARLWYPNDQLQHAGVILGIGGVAGHAHRFFPRGHAGYFGRAALTQQLSAVTGACLLIHRSIWTELGGLDEELAIAFNDIDLCLRSNKLGFKTVWTPYAELVHYESLSRGIEDTPEKVKRFQAEQQVMHDRYGDALTKDPFYSPNLTLVSEDFSLNWRARAH